MIVDIALDDDKYSELLSDAYGFTSLIPITIVLGTASLTSTAAFIANSNLIGLHVYLKIKGITTYEYILSFRRNKKNRVNELSLGAVGTSPKDCSDSSEFAPSENEEEKSSLDYQEEIRTSFYKDDEL